MAAHKLPIIEQYSADVKRAIVRFDGHSRKLQAFVTIDTARRPRLHVYGFAAQFATGTKLWNAVVIFYDRQGVWRHDETVVSDYPQTRTAEPPRIVGFIEDAPLDEVGIAYDECRAERLRDRASARRLSFYRS